MADAGSGPSWAENCTLRVRDNCLDLCGIDIAARIGAPLPTSLATAKALIRSRGARTVGEFMDMTFGPAVPSRLARRGDIARIGSAFGVVIGATAVFVGGEIPVRDVDQIWTVHHG